VRSATATLALCLASLTCLSAASAAAQDRDPFQAVKDAQDVRTRQMTQVMKAEDRIYDPIPHDGTPRAAAPVAAPPAEPRRDWAPWIAGGIAVVAIALLVRAFRRAGAEDRAPFRRDPRAR
jgi:hypothetical protein